MLDMKKVTEDAKKEVQAEKEEDAKKRIKSQIRKVESAKTILANEERELKDLYATITEGN